MTAYVIADIDVHDPEAYREYVALVPDTLKPHGGRFIVRGGASETLEGDWQPPAAGSDRVPQRRRRQALAWVAGVRPGAGHAPALRHRQPRAGRGSRVAPAAAASDWAAVSWPWPGTARWWPSGWRAPWRGRPGGPPRPRSPAGGAGRAAAGPNRAGATPPPRPARRRGPGRRAEAAG